MNRKAKRVLAVFSVLLLLFSFSMPTAGLSGEATNPKGGLIPGGMAFGVKFFTSGAVVLGTTGVETASGMTEPAKDAGIKSGDVITQAGGVDFKSAKELTNFISGSGGKPIVLNYVRNGTEQTTTVTPARDKESGEYKIGIFVRDSTAGIGTISYIDPETLDFGGLGHGIYESETGILLPLDRGAVVDVNITDIIKSEVNFPGELHGEFDRILKGELWDNTDQGVFGRFKELPKNCGEPIPVGSPEELKEGKAVIRTTLSGNEISEYEIEIEKIYHNSGNIKNFLIKVTDERLLEQTGGIVQGMSGSPIIQNGKLVGAVTHVLVNEPNHGYGIFIQNMLKSAYDVGTQQEFQPLAA